MWEGPRLGKWVEKVRASIDPCTLLDTPTLNIRCPKQTTLSTYAPFLDIVIVCVRLQFWLLLYLQWLSWSENGAFA